MNNTSFRLMLYGFACFICLIGVIFFTWRSWPRSLLTEIKKRDFLRCGISGTHYFGAEVELPDPRASANPGTSPIFYRNATGFDADFCRVIAIAIFGKAEGHVRFAEVDAESRFELLENGEIDVLIRISTCTGGREAVKNISCGPVIYFDETWLLVAIDSNIKNMADLEQQEVCALAKTTTANLIQTEPPILGIKVTPVLISTTESRNESNALVEAFSTNKRCVAIAGNVSRLLDVLKRLPDDRGYTLVDEAINHEPLTPFVKSGDEEWRKVISYAIYTTIYASEQKITSLDVTTCDEKTKRKEWFLGTTSKPDTPFFGEDIGLEQGFACQIIRLMGNYDEIYEKNFKDLLGDFKLQRGPNQVWQNNNGGRLYTPPLTAP